MFQARDVIQLETDERLVMVVRRHASTVLPGLLLAGVLLALPFFYLFPLIGMGIPGAIVIIGFLACGLFLAIKIVLLWDANVLLVTDRRVVLVRQQGVWDRRVTELPLAGLSVMVEKRGRLDRLRRTGQLGFMGTGSSTMIMPDIGRPERVASAINTLRVN